jgi:hypothetical protein
LVHTLDDRMADTSIDMLGICKIHNQLAYNIETFINGMKYIIDEITIRDFFLRHTIRDLSMINDDMIIGLRFLQHSVQTTIIHERGITFIPYQDNVPYVSEVRKCGGTKQILNTNTRLEETHDIPVSDKEVEISTSIETYYISNTNIECIGLQSFAPNCYRELKSKKDIEKIVQRFKDIQINGEIPMKYWDRNSITCKLI